jgi:hypothetical protein
MLSDLSITDHAATAKSDRRLSKAEATLSELSITDQAATRREAMTKSEARSDPSDIVENFYRVRTTTVPHEICLVIMVSYSVGRKSFITPGLLLSKLPNASGPIRAS